MKTVALISGGKDSCYNMMCCVAEGHQLVALANLRPPNVDELDSYMYQTVGHHAIDLYAEATGLPLYTQTITGASLCTGKDYTPHPGDEVEDLHTLLCRVKETESIEAVSVGAILSDYQRVRVENVCQRLGLVVLSFLWRRNQQQLLREMIECGVKAIIIKVAALGLTPDKHLGMDLSQIFPHMVKMKEKYGLNECGEGGEYETFVFDCPLFKKSIIIDEIEKVIHSDDAFAPVGYLNLKKCHVEDKEMDNEVPLQQRILQLPVMTSEKWREQILADLDVDHTQIEKKVSQDVSHITTHSSYQISGQCHMSFRTDGINFRVSGVTGLAEVEGNVTDVARQAMDALIGCVNEMGHSASDIVSVSLYLRDLSNFADINSMYKKYFSMNPPVRLCVEACLPDNILLQLDCQGQRLPVQGEGLSRRQTMHVQALSHWAPANIGPYSQAILTGNKLHMAGVVPLVPATLSVVEGDIRVECAVALRHIQEVMLVMCPQCQLNSCPMVLCFVTCSDHIPIAMETWESLAETCDSVTGDTVNPCIQYCVVPALPKGCLVEWQVIAWDTPKQELHDGENTTCFTVSSQSKDFTKWTIHTTHQLVSGQEHMLSCHISVCLSHKESRLLESSDVELLVKNLIELYIMNISKYSQVSSQPLAKVLYIAKLFDYDVIHQCFQKMLSTLISKPSERPAVSLVPVISLDWKGCQTHSIQRPKQVIAWCQ